MKLLFLDDERNVEDVTWVQYPEGIEHIVVRNYKEFMAALQKISPSELSRVIFSFDHDLQDFDEQGREYTGLTCATHMIDYFEANQIEYKGLLFAISHSQNPCGRENIEAFLKQVTHEDATCDGCGYTGPDVYHDGYGFNICRTNGCTQYSVRGLSYSDFL